MSNSVSESQDHLEKHRTHQLQSHHLLKIYSDNQSKRQQLIHWGLFFIITFVAFALVAALPHPTTSIHQGNFPCSNPIIIQANGSINCKPYDIYQTNTKGLIVEGLTQLNQFAQFSTNIYFKDTTLDLNYNGSVQISLNSIKYDNGIMNVTKKESKIVKLNLVSGSSTNFFDESGTFLGFTVELAYMRQITQSNYLFIANFSLSAQALTNIQTITLLQTSINKSFSVFSIVLRFIFFGFSVVALSFYVSKIKKLKWSQMIIEQKLVLILVIFCLFFNDPFYPITVLKPNNASNFFSVFFIINMVVALLFFWVCVLERIDVENGKIQTKVITFKKIIYMSFLYLFVLGYYLYFSYKHNSDPFVDVDEISSGFMLFLLVASIISLVLVLVKLLFSFINIYRYYETKIWRNKLFTNFSIFFVGCLFLFFFSNGFDIYSTFPNRIFLVFVQVNMYVFYLCFMYSPTQEAFQQQQQFEALNDNYGMLSNIDEDIQTVRINFNDEFLDIDEQQQHKVDRTNNNRYENKSYQNNDYDSEQQDYVRRNQNLDIDKIQQKIGREINQSPQIVDTIEDKIDKHLEQGQLQIQNTEQISQFQ